MSPIQLSDPTSFPKLTGTYGLLRSRTAGGGPGLLHLVKADGSLAATVGFEWNSAAVTCTGGADEVVALPPVSASNSHVYFREGSAIRMVVPPSSKVDITTVPAGSTVLSMFSVSPDDQKIAVVVVDTSSPTHVGTRLYVEDLVGGGHHADIYTASASRAGTLTTLWPMGWHQGNLILGVALTCGPPPPTEWHVSSPVTAQRVATIKGSGCQMSTWPSPTGVACAGLSGTTTLYDWSGKVLGVTGPGIQFSVSDTGLSPAGQSIYFSSGGSTRMVQLGPGPYATLQDHAACGWIDEDHLLSPDAVIRFPAETPGNVQVNTTVTALGQAGVCAGRFPGDL